MKKALLLSLGTLSALAALSPLSHAKAPPTPASSAPTGQTALTIYNQNFATVRENIALDLKQGTTPVRFADITTQLEPDSVILRDPSGKIALQILEQNYRNDPVSQSLLLSHYEGQNIDFRIRSATGEPKIVSGKVIRSGYIPQNGNQGPQYGSYNPTPTGQPIIEVDGKLQFSLPGEPIFPALSDDSILKPTLDWQIAASAPGSLNAELAYITGGLSWEASYNIVSPEKSDLLDLVGWVTMSNQSGKTFENASIKLMAGDVSKIQPQEGYSLRKNKSAMLMAQDSMAPTVTEKSFDEYHLYTLARPATLRHQETKQVEFIRASGIESQRLYVYDGLKLDMNQYRGYSMENIRNNENYGTEHNTKVAVMREFKNTEANHLGLPLPKGRVRFYTQDASDKRLEFTGENTIDHTAKNEIVRIFTGNAFDLVGERLRTDIKVDSSRRTILESFQIKLRNRKKEAVEIRVVEHLYRWSTWEITEHSAPFVKTDAQGMEFRVKVAPDEEQTITYTVKYTW